MDRADHEYLLAHNQETILILQDEITLLENIVANANSVSPVIHQKAESRVQVIKELLAECQKEAETHKTALRRK